MRTEINHYLALCVFQVRGPCSAFTSYPVAVENAKEAEFQASKVAVGELEAGPWAA